MPYIKPFVKVTFGGTAAGGEEIWSCGFSLDNGDIVDPAVNAWWIDLQTRLVPIAARIATYIDAPAVKVPNSVKGEWVKMALIGTDGKYMAEAVETQINATGDSAYQTAPQISVVNSLVSGKWKDPGRNNRFYMPASVSSTSGSWQLSTTERSAYVSALKSFVEDINDLVRDAEGESTTQINVVSNTATGSSWPVEEVRIGRLFDTQRRRRNQLLEDYASLSVDPI